MDIYSILEIIAVITGLASVYFTTKENIWCWPTGIVSTTLFTVVFLQARLYSDTLENFLYFFLQAYGWWFWLYGRKKNKQEKTVPIRHMRISEWALAIAAIVVGTAALTYFMSTYTNADFVFLDAVTTVMSLVAQWLLGKKIFENWILWITVDIIDLWVYFAKGLTYTGLLYIVFLFLATKGLIDWWKSKNIDIETAGKTANNKRRRVA